jgi:hypothetical protein
MRDLVEQIRSANERDDHALARRLNEHLSLLLAASPEKLLKTRELADWNVSARTRHEGDALAADALEELRDAALALGPSPSWH